MRSSVLPAMREQGKIVCWIVDDTGFPKKGSHSVGVAGSIAGRSASRITAAWRSACRWPPGQRVCRLPSVLSAGIMDRRQEAEEGRRHPGGNSVSDQATDRSGTDQESRRRRGGAGRSSCRCRLWSGWTVSGRHYRTGAGVCGRCAVFVNLVGAWDGTAAAFATQTDGTATEFAAARQDHQPVSAKQLASDLPAKEWKTVNWRQGTEQKLRSRFAAVRVRPAHRDYWQSAPPAEEWLLIEWPKGKPNLLNTGSPLCPRIAS